MISKGQVNQANFLLRYALQSFGVILLTAILIRIFLISSYSMAGNGMLPSVLPGDFLVAAKWSLGSVERGQVLVFRCPNAPDSQCLKRVIGLPGDRIEFQENRLVINGVAGRYQSMGAFESESMGAGAWMIWPDSRVVVAVEPVVVPPNMVYFLNDRREDDEDSRKWGAVSQDQIEGRILGVWMSFDWVEGEQIRSWPRIRWMRLFNSIR